MTDTTVEACGRRWDIPEDPSVDVLLKLRDWVAEQIGDPYWALADAIKFNLPEALQQELYKEGKDLKEQLKCLAPGCSLWERFVRSPAGGLKFQELQLRERYPDITPREASAVAMAYAEKLIAEKKAKGEPEGNGSFHQTPAEALKATAAGAG